MDLTLKNLQQLICYKTQTNKQTILLLHSLINHCQTMYKSSCMSISWMRRPTIINQLECTLDLTEKHY